VPYIDVADVFVTDPFGEFGDVPGLPLPAGILRVIAARVRSDDGRDLPLQVLEEQAAASGGGSTGLRAFVSANRLVPVRQSDQDWWSSITSVRLSLVICPELTALADTITLPAPCVEVLVAAAAVFLATASEKCGENDKRRFERQLEKAEAVMKSGAFNILSQVATNQVIVRR
jgi:hypothetical protein